MILLARLSADNRSGIPSSEDVRPFSFALRCSQTPCRSVGHLLGGEHVRVPRDQLVADAGRHVLEVETVVDLAGELGVEDHLEQQIAELLLEVRGSRTGPGHRLSRQTLDGLDHLAGLLDQVGNEAAMGLLGVPRALLAQGRHHRDEPLELGVGGHQGVTSDR